MQCCSTFHCYKSLYNMCDLLKWHMKCPTPELTLRGHRLAHVTIDADQTYNLLCRLQIQDTQLYVGCSLRKSPSVLSIYLTVLAWAGFSKFHCYIISTHHCYVTCSSPYACPRVPAWESPQDWSTSLRLTSC